MALTGVKMDEIEKALRLDRQELLDLGQDPGPETIEEAVFGRAAPRPEIETPGVTIRELIGLLKADGSYTSYLATLAINQLVRQVIELANVDFRDLEIVRE
jgi:hypothetical protein